MNRLRRILCDRDGSAFPLIVAVALAMVIVVCGVSEYFRLQTIAQGVRDAMQSAVIATVNDNYRGVYRGAREGYSGAYEPVDGGFVPAIGPGDVYGRMDGILGTVYAGDAHIKYTGDGGIEFRVWGLDVVMTNAPLASGDRPSQRFTADCVIELEVPVSFGGRLLPPMRITVHTTAGYTPKF